MHTFIKRYRRASALLLCLFFAGNISYAGNTSPGQTYYVNSKTGNDSNNGLSMETPWKTLEEASQMTYGPGDQLLLCNGSTFSVNLELKGGGTHDAPVVVSHYEPEDGTTALPVINAKGYLAAIDIRNFKHLVVNGLEITSDAGEPVESSARTERYGVRIVADQPGEYQHIQLINLYIHDIFATERVEDVGKEPTTSQGFGVGVFMRGEGTLLKDIRIGNCKIETTGRTGIKIRGNRFARVNGIKILNNQLKHIGGPGVVPLRCQNLIFRGNEVDHSGYFGDPRMHGRGSCIWTVKCENVLIEDNRLMHARGKMDSYGAHIDIGCRHVVIQYNMSIDNAGGFVQILGDNYNCTYRYNISVNDGHRVKGEDGAVSDGRLLRVCGYNGSEDASGPFNSYIYNNTIYVDENISSGFTFGLSSEGILIANNIFCILGPTAALPCWPKTEGNQIDHVVFRNNLYKKANIFPESLIITDTNPMAGDPEFVHPGGWEPEDYIPNNSSIIKDKGIEIEKLPGDSIGLKIGMEVKSDILGNPVDEIPDMGAIQIIDQPLCLTPLPPAIDGEADTTWGFATPDSIKRETQGNPASDTDLSATFRGTWDDESLYLLVDVKDDSLIHDSGNRPWEDDAVELWINGDSDKDTIYDANDYRYVFAWDNDTVYAYQDTALPVNPDGITFAQDTTATGYVMEIKIDWSAAGITPSREHMVGLNLQVHDDDTGENGDKKIAWVSNTGSSGLNLSEFGTILLENHICGAAKITLQPEDFIAGLNKNAEFIIQAEYADQYQWQVSQGATFANLSNNTTYSGVNTDTLHITQATPALTGYEYRCIVSNALGNDTSQTAILTVKDKEEPVFVASPGEQFLEAKSECQFTLPDYTGDVEATDNIDADLTIKQEPEPGTVISRSTVEVIITATDDFGNSAQAIFGVHAVDQIPPEITSTHNDQLLEADSECQAILPRYTYMVEATDNCYRMGELTITQTPEPYMTISGTAREIILTATDPEGNSSQVSFFVDVADQTLPTITCPEDQHIDLQQGKTVYTVTGPEIDPVAMDDNCLIDSITNDYTHTSSLAGAQFPVDTTRVVWTVTDLAGNNAQCNFEVIVSGLTGIDPRERQGIRLYPNPTGGMIHYEAGKTMIQKLIVLDLTGSIILEKNDLPAKGAIDITHLNSGIYFIQLSNQDGRLTEKITKD